jgi:hypothetical protein
MEAKGVTWRKASKSGNGGDCVEVAFGPDGWATGHVRDSKQGQAGHLALSRETFAAFLGDVKAGRYDLA